MKIEIKHYITGKILLGGEYESIKDCLEKNRGADLTWANLTEADLTGADLTGADLTRANLTGADLTGADLRWADLARANLTRANLVRADLTGADLTGANLTGADLTWVNLTGVKRYYNSHEIALEIIKRQKPNYFTNKEWSIIGKVTVHRFCWDKLRTDYKAVISIFRKLEKLGFNEYIKKFKGEIK